MVRLKRKRVAAGSQTHTDDTLAWVGCKECGTDVLAPPDTVVLCGRCVQKYTERPRSLMPKPESGRPHREKIVVAPDVATTVLETLRATPTRPLGHETRARGLQYGATRRALRLLIGVEAFEAFMRGRKGGRRKLDAPTRDTRPKPQKAAKRRSSTTQRKEK